METDLEAAAEEVGESESAHEKIKKELVNLEKTLTIQQVSCFHV